MAGLPEVPADALVVLVGPSGCGKSSWARQHFLDTQIVSSDECRRLVSDDEANQEATAWAFEVFYALIRGRLSLGRLTVADATNLHPRSRERLRILAAEYARPVVAVVFDIPLEVCYEQARGRSRLVAPEVIERQYALFERVKPELANEGYAAIHRLGPGQIIERSPAPAQ